MPGHRRSHRLQGHDYAGGGSYFVTLLTQRRACIFGRVVGGEMRLSTLGEIARDCWLQIPDHMPGIRLDAWTVMPNHLHAIIHITPVRASHGSPLHRIPVPTARSHPRGASRRSLGAIIALYKGASGRYINKLLGRPGVRVWHRDYHDHRIRHEAALDRIRRYIAANPARWDTDRNNPLRR